MSASPAPKVSVMSPPGHVQAQQKQKNAAGDPEGRQGDAEEPQQRQPGHVEKREEGEGEKGNAESSQAPPGGRGADGGGREQGPVADRVDEGE
jgi:hypothetical protein